MTPGPGGDTDTRDGELLADLFDTLLQEILEGRTPDLAAIHPDRPDLRERIAKAWTLACSVAGRREPGRPVLGGYEIVRELGHGGMGTVYLARHLALERDVAIKVLPHSLAMSPRAKERFLEEARSLARLRHEHVVHIHRILDHGEMLAFEMEFIAGPSLQKLILELRQREAPHAIETLAAVLGLPAAALGARNTVEWAVRLGIRIARALAEVHRHGLVHRDVKPSNILLRPDGRPVLADFGLARDGDIDGTHTGSFAGTPVYAAPERLRGGDGAMDARADVYSLGVTLYELLTMNPPFAGSSTHEVLRRIESGRLPSLRQQAPHVSRDLDTVLQKAMETDPRHRYATADALADDLERLLNLEPIHAKPPNLLRRAGKFVRRNHRLALAAAAGALLVAAIAWPLLAEVHAANHARERAAVALHAARLGLLSPDSLQNALARSLAGSSRQPLQRPETAATQAAALQTALRGYDEAIAGGADDASARLERDVVAAVLAIKRADGPDRPAGQLEACFATLPEAARDFARQVAHHAAADDATAARAAAAPAHDRLAAGLLAFLLGDLASSRRCWSGLDDALLQPPLLDAITALQTANDGSPDRAYPRLFHAAKSFPQAVSLALALADAALFMGDLPLAERWLAQVPEDAGGGVAAAQRRLTQADLLTAAGRRDEAATAYRELAQADPSDPVPLLRLCALATDRGDARTATLLLDRLVRGWPDLAAARLEAARLCLQRRDLPGYLAQARFALAHDYRRLPRGGASQFAEVLRLGGLHRLHQQLVHEHDLLAGSPLRGAALPLAHWLQKPLVASLEAWLEVAASFDRLCLRAQEVDRRPLGAMLRSACWHLIRYPELLRPLPPVGRAALAAAMPTLLGAPVDNATELLLPHGKSLGDRLQIIDNAALAHSPAADGPGMFGVQLLRTGDLDGDLLDDLCVACTDTTPGDEGQRVEVRAARDGSLVRILREQSSARSFAFGIAVLGDVDGDRHDDLLVGAPLARPSSTEPARIYLYSGRTGEVVWRIENAYPSFGQALVALSDLDGDGRRDFAVGLAPGDTRPASRGKVCIHSGASGELLREIVAERGGTWFGGALANAGDADGDGHDDLLVGGNFGDAPGLVAVHSARTGKALQTFADDATDTDFGHAVTGLGDVDGDGHVDFAIGAPASSSRGQKPGTVVLLSSRTGRILTTLHGDRPGDLFGTSLLALPDWRGDRRPAIAIAARRGGPTGTGYARTYDAATGQPMQTFAGPPVIAEFALAMVDLGDRDHDGLRELGITARQRDGGGMIYAMNWAMVRPRERGR